MTDITKYHRTVLITGGTGSFGTGFVRLLLESTPWTIRVLSRDEHKQISMEKDFGFSGRLRFMLGDVRDYERLKMATRGVDLVVHAAAYKCVQKCEYDPEECVKTNVQGTLNVVEAVLDGNVEAMLLISTDKAVQPINLYGATKMVAERLTIGANAYRGNKLYPKLCSTRYGNVACSRGTIVPIFKRLASEGKDLPITHSDSTRFWLTIREANEFVLKCLKMASESYGGEIYVPRIPSVRIPDVAKAVSPESKTVFIGRRPGDKLHEILITQEESERTVLRDGVFVIQPEFAEWGYPVTLTPCSDRRPYTSDNNEDFLSVEDIEHSIGEFVNA